MREHEAVRLLDLGSGITRYHQHRALRPQSVGEHSHSVVLLCWLLTGGKASGTLLAAAAVHDLGEYHSGDAPAPLKRANPALKAALEAAEDEALEAAGLLLHLQPSEWRVLKIADVLDGLLYTSREISAGNRDVMLVPFCTYLEYLWELKPYEQGTETPMARTVMAVVQRARGRAGLTG